MTKVPQVPVSAVDRFFGHWNRYIVFLSILDSIFASCNFPLSPWSYNVEFGIQGKKGEFKPDLRDKVAR